MCSAKQRNNLLGNSIKETNYIAIRQLEKNEKSKGAKSEDEMHVMAHSAFCQESF